MSDQTVALFDHSDGGVRLIGRSADPDLINYVRDQLATEKRKELARLADPVSLVRVRELEAES